MQNIGQVHAAVPQSSLKPLIKMEDLIAALKVRTLFSLIREALKHEKLPIGQGWADVSANAAKSTPQGELFQTFLRAYFAELTITGERYVQLYAITAEQTEELLIQIKGAVANSNTFSSTYPIPISQNLLSSAPSEPELCEIRYHENGDVSIILCSARCYDDKNAYEAKQLPKHVLDTYTGIDKLVTYRKVYYQAFDVITLRSKLNRIEICIDTPSKVKSSEIETLPLKILSACALHVSSFKGMGAVPPENLFPAIAGMYYQNAEGKVTTLSFRTMTGSIKKERMTQDSDDLRDEKFHHAGMNALGQKISPYELTLDYKIKQSNQITTLKLSALIRELSSATPTLHGCFVTSSSFASFEQTLNRLVTYLY